MILTETEFKIRDTVYTVDRFGVVHQQIDGGGYIYDKAYVESRYDVIPETVRQMSFLRVGLLHGICGRLANRAVLDVGYGNGDFLRVVSKLGALTAGLDVSGYPAPEGCRVVEQRDLLCNVWYLTTFFDSLEHIEDLEFLHGLQTAFLAITAPYYHELGQAWFASWKHRRPGEHLHHFNPKSLHIFLRYCGFEEIWTGSPEDLIRVPSDARPNTFTSVFKKL